MRVPLDEANVSLGLHSQGQQQHHADRTATLPLLSTLHPNRQLLVLARGPVLSILPVQDPEGTSGSDTAPSTYRSSSTSTSTGAPVTQVYTLRSSQSITALAWLCVLTSARQLGAASLTVRPPDLGDLLECECLLVGMQDGTLQLHSPSGRVLFRQKLHTGPVEHICVRPCSTGIRPEDPTEDVTVTFADALVRLSVLELRTHLKLLQLSRQSSGGGSVVPLTFQRWELPSGFGPRSSAACLGPRARDLDVLLSAAARGGGRTADQKLLIATGGSKPPLAGVEVEEHPQKSTLARLAGMAGSVTSGVVGAAAKAATLGPSLLGQGVRSLTTWVAGSYGDAQRAAAVPSYDLQHAPKPEASLPWRTLRDDSRRLGPLCPSPVGGLLAAADALGRVLLVNGANMTVLRMWKGYRDAQCGWSLPPDGHPWARHGLLLVLYAPRRELLEVWTPRSGVRVSAARVEAFCRLLPVAAPCGGWGNELMGRWQAHSVPSTVVLRLGGKEKGALWDVLELGLRG